METLNVKQGTQEWLAIRASHYTASEAAAMMSASPYQTRDELLAQKKTGIIPDVSPHQQAIFNHGHEVEELARPIIEGDIGEDLYPTVGAIEIDGLKLLASFDGLTLDGSMVFEHKLYTKKLADAVLADGVPDYYCWQLEHQLLVSGAASTLFVVSDGTKNNMVICDYLSIPERRAKLIDGWKQFHKDLEAFSVTAPEVELVAEAIPQLPALSVITKGEVVQSNLPQFKQVAISFIKSVNTDLQTDQDFVNAKSFVKFAQEGEDRLEAQKSAILAQTADIDEAIRTIDDVKAELRAKRLEIDKLVKTREQAIKIEIKLAGETEWLKHKTELQAGFNGLVQLIVTDPDLADAMKNKRTINSLRNAVNSEVASAKVTANQVARDIGDKLKFMAENANDHRFLFNDLQAIIYKPMDDLQLIVTTRIEQHKKAESKRLEQERQRIAAEEKAKAEREASEKLKIQQIEQERDAIKAHDENEKVNEKVFEKTEPAKTAKIEQTKEIPSYQAIITATAIGLDVSEIEAEAFIAFNFMGATSSSLELRALDYEDGAKAAENPETREKLIESARHYREMSKVLISYGAR